MGGKRRVFPSKVFCLTVPKNFIGQPFRVSLKSGIEKLYASEGYVTFSVEVFLSHNAEKICRGTLLCCVPENFRQRKSLWIRSSGIIIFRRKFYFSQCRKSLQGNPSVLCFRKFPEAKKFMDKMEGEVTRFSVENFWSHIAEKFRRATI